VSLWNVSLHRRFFSGRRGRVGEKRTDENSVSASTTVPGFMIMSKVVQGENLAVTTGRVTRVSAMLSGKSN